MMCIVESHKWCGNSTIAEVEYISTELYESIKSPSMSATTKRVCTMTEVEVTTRGSV
jgi:hypothetical protein